MQFSHFLFILLGAALVHCKRQEKALNRAQTYVLGWEVDFEAEEITFDVTAPTRGFVGFGLNYRSDMAGADIIIGGVDNDGKPYFTDRHATSKSLPMTDTQQDWFLLEAREDATSTYLKFKRSLNTCDDKEDITITKDTLTAIWSFGDTDDITGHSTNRGGRSFNFLDNPKPPIDLSKLVKESVRVRDVLPSADTSYLCSFHKFEALPTKHHAIALEVFLENEVAERHTHHFAATQCFMDDNTELEALVGKPAMDCESPIVVNELKPRCRDMLFGWGIGGELTVLPDHVGIEVRPNEIYYIMLEIHYDNPNELVGVEYTTGFDVYFTPDIRPNEGAVLMVGSHVAPSLMIPPLASDYLMVGHCSPEFTSRHVPPEGVNIVSVNAHSHIAGRKTRLRHFRNGKELPWLVDDQNYDSNYQQVRELSQEVKLMPGDQLTMECTYDTLRMGRTNVTLGGESTREEMCHSFIFYYPKMDLLRCTSGKALEEIFGRFGVFPNLAANWFNPPILLPPEHAGKDFYSFLNQDVNWTAEVRADLANDIHYGRHWATHELSPESFLNRTEGNVHRIARGPLGTPTMEPMDDRYWIEYPQLESEYVPEVDARCIALGENGANTVVVTPLLALSIILLSWSLFL